MISIRWVDRRKAHWEQLGQLVERSRSGLGGLGHDQLSEFARLYRQTAADLSTIQQDPSSAQLAAYLNQLLARSHNLIYFGRRRRAGELSAFFLRTYPRLFRQTLPATLSAVGIFVFAFLAGWALTLHDAGFAHRLLGPAMMESIEKREMWTHSIVGIQPLAASSITTNNLTVAFTAFALGITAVGTVWMMLFNGLLMGAVGAATWRAGMALSLWSFVAPHGVLELPAICIAGGAGLELARGLLFPGLLPRRAALVQAGGRATRLLLGAVPLLLVAGAIEGFFSPSSAPVVMKFTLAALLGGALLLWLLGVARRPTPGSAL